MKPGVEASTIVRMNTKMTIEETIIIGAGPIGLACALSAKRRGIDPLVIDAGIVVNSIAHYPPHMVFFTTPELLEIGGHPFPCAGEKPTRIEALKYYRGIVRSEGIRVRPYTKLLGASRTDDGIVCRFEGEDGEFDMGCEHLVLASGYFDQKNRLGVPGEDLPHVHHVYDEGHWSFERDVVVVGGKNSGIEAALDLYRSGGRVTLVHRYTDFKKTVKYWIKPDILNRISAGEIAVRMGAQVERIDRRSVTIRSAAGEETLPADRVYVLIGFQPDWSLFERIGIHIDDESGRPEIDEKTHESNVPGVYLAGSIVAGKSVSSVFIENGRFDGDKIFGSIAGRSDGERS